MAKKEVLPTDALLSMSFVYPDRFRTGMGSGKGIKDRPIVTSTAILEARISPKYRPPKSKVR